MAPPKGHRLPDQDDARPLGAPVGGECRARGWVLGPDPPQDDRDSGDRLLGSVSAASGEISKLSPELDAERHGGRQRTCLDAYVDYAKQQGQASPTDPSAQGDGGSPRVLRGGAFNYEARYLRSTNRFRFQPVYRGRGVGFRCVLAARRQPLPSGYEAPPS
ncbi:MAG TPA: SUMF1/EgtB/PvdO family nonheme iron enzyme [Lamprocystis sp. (in: g-proteobacteria)]|nr:SUMF1/EgtB/PvdO family nonheme iron enzyme [Lamprocystis sp. (in: g-proteobacteria)]